jgi:protein-L-isoaspartate(D-aspartate) O-methyltransferase
MVGFEGTVTTVDIDPEVTDRASSLLGEAGYSRVNVVLSDAETGVPEHAPYDRIIEFGLVDHYGVVEADW